MGILHINGVQVLLNEQLSPNKKDAVSKRIDPYPVWLVRVWQEVKINRRAKTEITLRKSSIGGRNSEEATERQSSLG